MKKSYLLILFIAFSFISQAQVVFQDIHSSVYEFLDEMANLGYIELNTAVKPYSRKLIAKKLDAVQKNYRNDLTKRQKQELDFYLRDFGKELHKDKNFKRRKDLFYYRDDTFAITVNPILGFEIRQNTNGMYWHRWNGAHLWGYAGKHFGFNASLRDNGVNNAFPLENQLMNEPGANFKINQGQTGGRSDYSEMKGGVSYGWDWGSVSLNKDNFTWGNNYNGANIFSGRQPSYVYLQFKMNPKPWFDFNYVHGFLVSEVIDSSRTYYHNNGRREIFHPKYMAANLYTFTPWKKFKTSFGNSVIYSDVLNYAYMIPFFFFKSVDHTYNGAGSSRVGQNSQMFFDISSRNIKKTHLYATLFLDELSISNMWKPDKHTNLYSLKTGMRLSNVLFNNTSLTIEYTRTNPWTFTHDVSTTTFTSNNYNLGHYLLDNSEEIFIQGQWKPIKRLHLSLSYTQALKGPKMVWKLVHGNTNVPGSVWMEEVTWYNKTIMASASYEIINDGMIYFKAQYSDIQGIKEYTPELYQGKTLTFWAGMYFGL
tara:strand:- start:70693 stop:72306 length:1614 start_codon:yes stop_codon:yes gene_type:complete